MPSSIARLFCVGFDGPTLTPDLRRLIDRGIGGVILFSRNIESPRQVGELCAAIKREAGRPIFIAIDHEGGRVQRLGEPFTPIPSMRSIGQRDDGDLAERIGGVIARELRAVNIDLDFAPVMDVDTNPANPVIGDRSFSRSPEVVARLGRRLIRGMQSAGLAACAKHFPGHGDTSQDSHLDLPRLPHDLARLEAIELPPFRAACDEGVASIMTAHVMFEALDRAYPATMSRPCLDGILRDRWGYEGVVFSDDLEMKAVAGHYALEDAVVRSVLAGVDVLLVCHSADTQNRAIDALDDAAARGVIPATRLARSNERIDAICRRFVREA